MINYGRQSITDDDIQAVVDVLKSDYLTQGPAVSDFEKSICDYTGASYCVAVANGTAALHLAVLALELQPGSRGVTTPITFAASANAMRYAGLQVDFADIDSRTYNVSTLSLEPAITSSTKLVIPVHFAGQPCDMPAIKQLADRNGLKIIEDAAHAIGSSYADGDRVGSCRYSDLTTFSFHPVKTITTGEGGAITTNDEDLYRKLLLLRTHGITKDPGLLKQNPGPWYYEMQALGYNYRLTDMQAALGASQMQRLDGFKQRRRELVRYYNEAFRDRDWLGIPYERDGVDSCFHLYVLQIDFKALGINRAEVMGRLRDNGIGTQVHYIPVHKQPYYEELGPSSLPNAEEYYSKALSIPLYPDMSDEDQEAVIRNILDLAVKE